MLMEWINYSEEFREFSLMGTMVISWAINLESGNPRNFLVTGEICNRSLSLHLISGVTLMARIWDRLKAYSDVDLFNFNSSALAAATVVLGCASHFRTSASPTTIQESFAHQAVQTTLN